MNGAQDMGGVHGFGAVVAELDEPVFHADWERRVFALTLAMGATGEWNLDASRFARENRRPDEYLDKSYYEIWLAGLEQLLAERGLATEAELTAGESSNHASQSGRPSRPPTWPQSLAAAARRTAMRRARPHSRSAIGCGRRT